MADEADAAAAGGDADAVMLLLTLSRSTHHTIKQHRVSAPAARAYSDEGHSCHHQLLASPMTASHTFSSRSSHLSTRPSPAPRSDAPALCPPPPGRQAGGPGPQGHQGNRGRHTADHGGDGHQGAWLAAGTGARGEAAPHQPGQRADAEARAACAAAAEGRTGRPAGQAATAWRWCWCGRCGWQAGCAAVPAAAGGVSAAVACAAGEGACRQLHSGPGVARLRRRDGHLW